jgi:hypothetical protein
VDEPREQCAQAMARAGEVDDVQRRARAQHADDLAQHRRLLSALQVVEHERRDHPVEARSGERQRVAEALLERDLHAGPRRLGPRAGERLRVGVEPDELDPRLRGLRNQRERAGPAAQVEHALARHELGVRDQLALRGRRAQEARERIVERQEPVGAGRGDEVPVSSRHGLSQELGAGRPRSFARS